MWIYDPLSQIFTGLSIVMRVGKSNDRHQKQPLFMLCTGKPPLGSLINHDHGPEVKKPRQVEKAARKFQYHWINHLNDLCMYRIIPTLCWLQKTQSRSTSVHHIFIINRIILPQKSWLFLTHVFKFPTAALRSSAVKSRTMIMPDQWWFLANPLISNWRLRRRTRHESGHFVY